MLHFINRVRRAWRLANVSVPPPPINRLEVARLTSDQFAKLRDALPRPGFPKDSLDAAFLLGVQHTLEVLRKGWVVNE